MIGFLGTCHRMQQERPPVVAVIGLVWTLPASFIAFTPNY